MYNPVQTLAFNAPEKSSDQELQQNSVEVLTEYGLTHHVLIKSVKSEALMHLSLLSSILMMH